MKVPQVSVFLENRRGRLHEACECLSKAGISLITLALADTADFGVMRFIVNDPGKAAEALKGSGFTAIINDVLAIEVPDRPGGLAEILEVPHHHLHRAAWRGIMPPCRMPSARQEEFPCVAVPSS